MEGSLITSQCMETMGGTVFKDLEFSVSLHSSIVFTCFPQFANFTNGAY
jgi:hypothetical protein